MSSRGFARIALRSFPIGVDSHLKHTGSWTPSSDIGRNSVLALLDRTICIYPELILWTQCGNPLQLKLRRQDCSITGLRWVRADDIILRCVMSIISGGLG